MPTRTIEPERIRVLADVDPADGDYVLYWMQQSHRAEDNPALEYAVQQANELEQRLLVGFGLTDDYPGANRRHYAFMLEGIADAAETLADRGVKFVVRRGSPDDVAIELGRRASIVVCDGAYLRHEKQWRRRVARELDCRVVQVEANVVVPVETASDKAEFAARTLRPKIEVERDRFLVDLRPTKLDKHSLGLSVDSIDIDGPRKRAALLDAMDLDESVPEVGDRFRGGTREAKRRFDAFLKSSLKSYDEHRDQPMTDDVSFQSMYLHFGQVSPVWLAGRLTSTRYGTRADKDTYLEELVVRRELAVNFVYYTSNYDRYAALPDWARTTLAEHTDDTRPHRYTRKELDEAATHDEAWNAAMRDMKHTGTMHNYMRMYWGKKILEWSNTPEYAHRIALDLNNRYFLDGRDCSSFANVGWLFGLHDRPWGERDVFGKVRSMTADGLKRKFDVDAYIDSVNERLE